MKVWIMIEHALVKEPLVRVATNITRIGKGHPLYHIAYLHVFYGHRKKGTKHEVILDKSLIKFGTTSNNFGKPGATISVGTSRGIEYPKMQKDLICDIFKYDTLKFSKQSTFMKIN